MTVPLIHPRFMDMHRQFLPSQARPQAKAVIQDEYGQETEEWFDVGFTWATRAPLSAVERDALGYTATDRVWNVLLQGAYPQITTRHRVTVDGDELDIEAVETDQTGSVTRLRVRQTTT